MAVTKKSEFCDINHYLFALSTTYRRKKHVYSKLSAVEVLFADDTRKARCAAFVIALSIKTKKVSRHDRSQFEKERNFNGW